METERWYLLWLNPEPWAIGTVAFKSITPDPNLAAYQQAVKEELEEVAQKLDGELDITFLFWRQQARYIDTADHIRQRNQADATNMQKALEDALQGVLYDNDRNVRRIESLIVEQNPLVEPRILIRVRPFTGLPDIDHLMTSSKIVYEGVTGLRPRRIAKNTWPPRSDS